MRVLIDESLPRQLIPELTGYDAHMVQELGWSSLKNGELIRRAAADGFEALVTADRNLEYQQNIPRAGLGIVVLRAQTNRIEDILPMLSRLLAVLPNVKPGTVTYVGVR